MKLSEKSARDRNIRALEGLLGLITGSRPAAVVVAAHPDDETIGAGAHLHRFERLSIVEVTDGSPVRLANGFASRHAYAAARHRELLAALHTGGVPPERLVELGIVDQEASLDLSGLTRLILRQLWNLQPDAVLTHPYEGGHPDHDACAFAVQEACGIMERAHLNPPARIEMAGYHARSGEPGTGMAAGVFLPAPGCYEAAILLDPERRALKRHMFACFRTQQAMLANFPTEVERFRTAPRYDFTLPPHPGELFYERFDWGISGRRWRELAGGALRELEPVAEP